MTQPPQAQVAQPTVVARAECSRSFAPAPFDVLLVVLLGVGLPIALALSASSADKWVQVLAGGGVVAPLLWRSRAPVAVLAVEIGIAAGVFAALGGLRGPNAEYLWVPMLFALGAVAARCAIWISLLGLLASYVAVVLSVILAWPQSELGWTLISTAFLCTIAWMIGVFARTIRLRVDRLELERQRSQADLRVERQKIASDVEAVIEPAVRRIRSHAGAARRSISADPAATVGALSAVEADGVEAMQELQRLVRRLDAERAVEVRPELAPLTLGARVRRRILSIDAADLIVTLLAVVATIVLTIVADGGLTLPAVVFLPALIVLVWRNQFPVVVFALIFVSYAGVVVLFHGGDFVWDDWFHVVGLLVALASAAGNTRVWLSVPLALITWASLSMAALLYPYVLVENVTSYGLFVAVVWTAGYLGGRRRRRLRQLQRDREAAARQVRREHAELARDLHDLIGHSITIMVLQAAGARRILAQDPVRATAALDAIDGACVDALSELDQLVGLLQATPESLALRTPMRPAGLADIDEVIEHARSGVREVEMLVHGDPSPLPPETDATAFAVVRQAIANAEKHGGGSTRIALEFEWGRDSVVITVTNSFDSDTRMPATNLSGGYGLASLRDRVRGVGGDLTWAAHQESFSVRADFPIAH